MTSLSVWGAEGTPASPPNAAKPAINWREEADVTWKWSLADIAASHTMSAAVQKEVAGNLC